MQVELAPCSVKKEPAVGVKVKKETLDEQEVNQESLQKASIEMDDVLLQVKLEIHEEMEQDMKPLSFESDDMHGVGIKQEIVEKPQPDFKVLQMKSGSVELAIQERAQEQSDDAAQSQRLAEPAKTLAAKRRRLTRRDWQKTTQIESQCGVKKELVSGVKVKQERLDEQKVNPQSPQEKSNENDDVWLQVLRKEINRRCSVNFTSAGDGGLCALQVPNFGVGAWAWGDRLFWGYDENQDRDLREGFDACIKGGVKLFDTAEIYGPGRSEELLGKFLRESGAKDVQVATKFAAFPWKLDRQDVVKACKGSLERSAAVRAISATLGARGIPLTNGMKETCDELGVKILAYSPLALGTSVAIAWCIAKGTTPIPGVRNVRQAEDNIRATTFKLSDNEVKALDSAAEPRRKSYGI
eukprot:Skav235801  [mRNA]  locus=scaffold1267:193295:206325:- [translate_table: standard]